MEPAILYLFTDEKDLVIHILNYMYDHPTNALIQFSNFKIDHPHGDDSVEAVTAFIEDIIAWQKEHNSNVPIEINTKHSLYAFLDRERGCYSDVIDTSDGYDPLQEETNDISVDDPGFYQETPEQEIIPIESDTNTVDEDDFDCSIRDLHQVLITTCNEPDRVLSIPTEEVGAITVRRIESFDQNKQRWAIQSKTMSLYMVFDSDENGFKELKVTRGNDMHRCTDYDTKIGMINQAFQSTVSQLLDPLVVFVRSYLAYDK